MNEVVIVSAVRTAGGRIGGTLKDVCALMGHSSVTTTEIYVDYSERQAELVMMI